MLLMPLKVKLNKVRTSSSQPSVGLRIIPPIATSGFKSLARIGSVTRCSLGQRFGQEEKDQQQPDQRQARRREQRGVEADLTDRTANCGALNQPRTPSHANQRKIFRQIVRRGDVGDVRRSGREIAPADPVDHAREEQYPQRAADAEDHVADRRAEDAYQQDGAASEAVAELVEQRRSEKLRRRVQYRDHRDHQGVVAVALDDVRRDGPQESQPQ